MHSYTGQEPRVSNGSRVFSTLRDAVSRGEGATANLINPDRVETRGYYVAGTAASFTVPLKRVKTNDYLDFIDYARSHAAEWVGAWIHGYRVWFDVVDHVPDLEGALDLARERGEIAIYDIERGEEVYV